VQPLDGTTESQIGNGVLLAIAGGSNACGVLLLKFPSAVRSSAGRRSLINSMARYPASVVASASAALTGAPRSSLLRTRSLCGGPRCFRRSPGSASGDLRGRHRCEPPEPGLDIDQSAVAELDCL
jgi:hypothetical protein